MADPPVDNNMADQGELAKKASEALSGYSAVVEKAGTIFNALQDKVASLSGSFSHNHNMTTRQVQAMGLLTNAVLGTRDAFQGLGGIDSSGLNTFTGQVEQLQDLLKNSPAYKFAEENLKKVTLAAKDMAEGIGGPIAKAAIKGAEDALKSVTKVMSEEALATAKSADNALRLRDVYTMLAAKTGDLGDVHEKAGEGFKNMNALIAMQQQTVSNTIKATNLSAAAVEKYYAQLGTIPGALNASTDSLKGMTGGTNLLTSTIQLARGAGMQTSDAMELMRKSIVSYGSSIPEALSLTAKISEVSKKYKIELDDVKQAVLGVSEAFKHFGSDTTSGTAIMNQYVGALKGTGLSGQVSAEIVGNMTKQISQLSIAQKAFISAQSGGPGGLQGAFGIDMMLRKEGGQKKVMDMVMKTMKDQMGSLVSTEEASQGGPAAAQFSKQIMMLQSGPLGGLAKSLPEAEHLIDAMKAMSEGKPVEDLKKPQDMVQKTMEEGAKYQAQTATGISRMVGLMEESRGAASGSSLSLLQSGFTAGAGQEFHDTAKTQKGRNLLKNSMAEGGRRDATDNLNNGDEIRDQSGKITGRVVNDWGKFIKDVPPMLLAPIQGIQKLFKAGNANKATEEYKEHLASNQRKREELKNAPTKQRAAGLAKIDREESILKSGYATAAMNGGEVEDNRILKNAPDMGSKARLVGGAAESVNKAANRSVANTANAPGTAHAHGAQSKSGEGGAITVKVEGVCINCGDKMRNQDQSAFPAPQALMPK